MSFRNPITSFPASAITGQIDPATQIAPGTLADGILLPTDQLAGLVPTTQLSGQIAFGQIAANAVGANQIAAGAIVAGKIAADSITSTEIAAGAVTASELAAGSVVAGTIAANAVTSSTIAAGSIDGKTITGALLRTAAAGLRVEIDGSYNDEVRLFTGNGSETDPGKLIAFPGGFLKLVAPTLSGGGHNVAYLYLDDLGPLSKADLLADRVRFFTYAGECTVDGKNVMRNGVGAAFGGDDRFIESGSFTSVGLSAGSPESTGSGTLTYPAAFGNTPVTTFSCNANSSRLTVCNNGTTQSATSTTYRVTTTANSSTGVGVYWHAISS